MLPEMAANLIVRKLVALVFALTLAIGSAPAAVAATRIGDCGMVSTLMDMHAMDMRVSMSQDQQSMPMHDHQIPSKDLGSMCTTACGCAIGLPQIAYSPVLASRPAMPGWALQTKFASVFSRPDLPPPIAIL